MGDQKRKEIMIPKERQRMTHFQFSCLRRHCTHARLKHFRMKHCFSPWKKSWLALFYSLWSPDQSEAKIHTQTEHETKKKQYTYCARHQDYPEFLSTRENKRLVLSRDMKESTEGTDLKLIQGHQRQSDVLPFTATHQKMSHNILDLDNWQIPAAD